VVTAAPAGNRTPLTRFSAAALFRGDSTKTWPNQKRLARLVHITEG
jgi:hypothetical protein